MSEGESEGARERRQRQKGYELGREEGKIEDLAGGTVEENWKMPAKTKGGQRERKDNEIGKKQPWNLLNTIRF